MNSVMLRSCVPVNSISDKVPVKLVVIPGTGHFFEGHLDELKTAVYDWVSMQLNE